MSARRIRLSYRDEVNVVRPVLAGVVTALVGFGGAFPVVLAGLGAIGADERQAASGLLAVCLASGSSRWCWGCAPGCR